MITQRKAKTILQESEIEKTKSNIVNIKDQYGEIIIEKD